VCDGGKAQQGKETEIKSKAHCRSTEEGNTVALNAAVGMKGVSKGGRRMCDGDDVFTTCSGRRVVISSVSHVTSNRVISCGNTSSNTPQVVIVNVEGESGVIY
jgi:hypothetical protein